MRNFVSNLGPQDIYPLHAFQLRKGPTLGNGYELIKAVTSSGGTVPAPIFTSQRWPSGRGQYTFKISKENGQLAGAILLEHIDGKRLVIRLGSTTDFGVGFEVASVSVIEDFEEPQRLLNSQAPGTNMALKNHQVRVNANPRIHSGTKYYMVDIIVEALYHAPDPIDTIKEIIPRLQSQSDERPPNAIVASRGLGKLKFPRIHGRSKAPVKI